MARTSGGESNGRFSRQDWIDAARPILIERGIDDVRVGPLAAEIGVTRGSFYWHFTGLTDFRQALLEDWEARNGLAIVRIRSQLSDQFLLAHAMMESLFRDDVALPPFETTLRIWARRSADGREAVGRIDDSWISLFQDILELGDFESSEAAARARFLYRFLFGLNITRQGGGADLCTFDFGDLVARPTAFQRRPQCVDDGISGR